MSKIKRDNRKHVPQLLVAGANTALQSSGSLVGSGAALNISNGQLGLVSWDFNGSEPVGDFMQAGDAATVEFVKLIQGTPLSSNVAKVKPWETKDPAYVDSGIIARRNIRSFAASLYKPARLGAHAFAGFGTPQDEELYKAYAFLYSVRLDKYYGDNDNVIASTFTTPNYTALGTVSPLDHMLQNLAYKFNAQSKLAGTSNPAYMTGNKDFVVLGVNVAGGSGAVIGDLVCGDVVTFMSSTAVIAGNPTAPILSSFVVDAATMRALAGVITGGNAGITAASTIEVIDLSTAGQAATVDALIFLSLEEETSEIFDDVAQVIPRVEASLGEIFRLDGTIVEDVVAPEESVGDGRKMKIFEDNQARIYRFTMQKQPFMEFINEGYTYVDPTKNYNMYTLDFFDYEETLTTREHYPKQLVILCPVADAICDGVVDVDAVTGLTDAQLHDKTGLSNTTAASLETIFAAWLKSANTVSPFPVLDAATSSTYFA